MEGGVINEENEARTKEIFTDTVRILKENGINFWLCQGTLLGIIRENRLIPWDRDIDFGVWIKEVSKPKIIQIFVQNGFLHKPKPSGDDSLEFFGNANKRIEINFYRSDGNIASSSWIIPGKNIFRKFKWLYKNILRDCLDI